MSDAWEHIQAVKNKRNSIREKLQKRKSERQHLLSKSAQISCGGRISVYILSFAYYPRINALIDILGDVENLSETQTEDVKKVDIDIERSLLEELSNVNLSLPVSSRQLLGVLVKSFPSLDISHSTIINILNKFALQKLIE